MSPDTSPYDTMIKVMRDLRRAYDQRAAAVGLTMSRLRVLVALSRNEGCTQAELAAILQIEVPTLKRQIDALETQGFLTRSPIAGDERKRALSLTDRARAIAVTKFAAKARQDIFSGMTEAEIAAFHRGLLQIEDNLARITAHE